LKKGDLSEGDIDRVASKAFYSTLSSWNVRPPALVKYTKIPFSENDSEAHRTLALEVARQSMVLLKNDGHSPAQEANPKDSRHWTSW